MKTDRVSVTRIQLLDRWHRCDVCGSREWRYYHHTLPVGLTEFWDCRGCDRSLISWPDAVVRWISPGKVAQVWPGTWQSIRIE